MLNGVSQCIFAHIANALSLGLTAEYNGLTYTYITLAQKRNAKHPISLIKHK